MTGEARAEMTRGKHKTRERGARAEGPRQTGGCHRKEIKINTDKLDLRSCELGRNEGVGDNDDLEVRRHREIGVEFPGTEITTLAEYYEIYCIYIQ